MLENNEFNKIKIKNIQAHNLIELSIFILILGNF